MIGDYTLAYGTHATPEDGRCAMEWVSHLAGAPHGDSPACVSPVLRAMCIALNDGLEDGPRQRLRPYLARTIGTADDGLDPERAWLALDWLTRTYTPAWLRLADLQPAAEALRELPEVVDEVSLGRALRSLQDARRQARAARANAFAAPRGAGWATALTAGLAGREGAWACAGAAAWAAARVGVGDIAGDRARAAARAAAGDAAAIATRRARMDSGRDGGDAAAIATRRARLETGRDGGRDDARAALAPTLAELTESALALLDRMLPTEQLAMPEPARAALEPVAP